MTGSLPRWVRIWRYTIGSVVAAVTSFVVFAAAYDVGAGPTAATVLAFVAGAVPNWVLNRTWAWQRRGRLHVRREVVLYAVVSVVNLAASAAVTGWVSAAAPTVTSDHMLRVLLVATSYVATYGVLFVAKFVTYELVVFPAPDPDHEPEPDLRRSRHQVPTTTRANRAP